MSREPVIKLLGDAECGELEGFRCLCLLPADVVESRIREFASLTSPSFRLFWSQFCKTCAAPGQPGAPTTPPAGPPTGPGTPNDVLSRIRELACSNSAKLGRVVLSGAIAAARARVTDPTWVRVLDAADTALRLIDGYCATADMPASQLSALCTAWRTLRTVTSVGDASAAGVGFFIDALGNLLGSELGTQLDVLCGGVT